MAVKKSKKILFRNAVAISLLFGAVGCAQIQGVPLGSTQVATFTTSQGQQLEIMQLPNMDQYELYAPGTTLQAFNLPLLNGFSNLTFLGSQALGNQTAVFFEAAYGACNNRHFLLVLAGTEVRSILFSNCDSDLQMLPQADGVSLGFRNTHVLPAYYYVYRDGVVYGPIYEQKRRVIIRHKVAHETANPLPAKADTPPEQVPEPAAPVDLDKLDVPTNAPAVNLDK